MKLRIQTSLLLFFLIVMLLSLPVFFYLSLRMTTRLVDQQVRFQLVSEVSESVERIKMMLAPNESVLERLSENYALQQYLRTRELLEQGSLAPEERNRLEEEVQLWRRGIEDELNRLIRLNPEFLRAAFLDDSGQPLIQAGESGIEQDQVYQELFEFSMEKNRGESVIEDRILNGGVLRYSMPVIRDENVGVESEVLQPAAALLGTPFREQEGIVVIDYRFAHLRDQILSMPVVGTPGASLFLIDGDDNILAVREERRNLIEDFLARQEEIRLTYRYKWRGENYLLSLWPYKERRWHVGLVVPEEDFTQVVNDAIRILLIVSIAVFIVVLFVALYLIGRISGPLQEFVSVAQEISQGNFSIRVRPSGGKEISGLAQAFNNMAARLESYVESVRKKEQLDQELKIAESIQTNLLPKTLPRLSGIQMAARTIPAREVGGDYFDFLLNGNQTLSIAIGDVTGRGVPAALLMTMTRSVLRSQVRPEEKPSETLERTNQQLFGDVQESRHSVAMFFGYLHSENREFHYSNAGQMFPLWYRDREQKWEYLERPGIPLGIRKDTRYESQSIILKPGDRLVFYTDGLVESSDNLGDRFGFDRFEKLVEETRQLEPEDAIERIFSTFRFFTGSEEPDDDLTLAILDVVH
jgi:serine phosphatase RsbU (regulator of sigma subunit)